MLHKLLQVLAGISVEPECRSCRQAIDADDAFGRSERVCRPCRR